MCKSRETTVMAAVFLIVPVSYYKKAISSGSTSLRGAVLKRSVGIWWLFYSVRSLLEIWRKFSNALKTAAEVKSFKNSQQGFVQELGATACMWLCRYTGVCVRVCARLYVFLRVWTDSYNSASLELVNKEIATW